MTISSIGPSVPKAADNDAVARSVTYPRVDEDALARRIFATDYERTPGTLQRLLTSAGVGAATLGGIGAGVGIWSASRATQAGNVVSKSAMASRYGMMGAVAGVVAGLGVGLLLNRMTPERAREYAQESLDITAQSRPPLPPASAVPTEKVGVPGVVRDGISGSTVGGIVQLKQTVMGDVTTRSTTTRNSAGEPTIVIGSGSGEKVTTEAVVRTENATLNSIGLGRVLYDPEGYGSMSEAMEAYDGKHAAAIVKEGDRYLLVDVDAESWSALGDRSYAMSLADDRVKAVFANKGVYYPSTISGSDKDGPRLFMFAQEQDIDDTLPPDVRELKGQPIGTYQTNSKPAFNNFAERYQLHMTDFVGKDEYSGYGFTSREDAVQFMSRTDGNQALVKSGDRYYVSNLDIRNGTGDSVGLSSLVNDTPQGSAVLGLTTNDTSSDVTLIEDEGGLFAPVDDWWVRARTEG